MRGPSKNLNYSHKFAFRTLTEDYRDKRLYIFSENFYEN